MPVTPKFSTGNHTGIAGTWTDDAGSPVDLTGATITARFVANGGSPAPFTGTGTAALVVAASGTFTYKYSTADLATAATYQVYFRATFADATIEIGDPITVVIQAAP